MKLEKARQAYYDASGTASTVFRHLALAGIAVVWLLAGGLQTSGVNLTRALLIAGLLLIIALFLDLAQYVWTTSTWAIWTWIKEREKRGTEHGKNVDDEDIGDSPAAFLPTMWVFFYMKLAVAAAAYIVLLIQLAHRIRVS